MCGFTPGKNWSLALHLSRSLKVIGTDTDPRYILGRWGPTCLVLGRSEEEPSHMCYHAKFGRSM